MSDTTGHRDPKAIVRAFVSDGVIPPKSIVQVGAADGEAKAATVNNQILLGVSMNTTATADHDRVDVCIFGPCEVHFGAGVAAGLHVMTDGNGEAIAFVAGAGVWAVGKNLGKAQAHDDIGEIFVNPTEIGA